MWNEPAAANWAHFALTLVSLRGEPITTSLLQSRAKITEIPSSSPERRRRAVRKMPTPRFLIRLALQILVEITHALHSLPANDSSSLRDQAERGKWGRRQKMEVEGYGKRNIDGSKMLTSIIADSKTCPRSRWFSDWNTEHWRHGNIRYGWLLHVGWWPRSSLALRAELPTHLCWPSLWLGNTKFRVWKAL